MGLSLSVVAYLLDTNIAIHLLKGMLAGALPPGRTGISVITEIELRCFPRLDPQQEAALMAFCAGVVLLPLDDAVKEAAIRLRRNHRLKTPDAIIAGTAQVQGATLLTNDGALLGLRGVRARRLALRGPD